MTSFEGNTIGTEWRKSRIATVDEFTKALDGDNSGNDLSSIVMLDTAYV